VKVSVIPSKGLLYRMVTERHLTVEATYYTSSVKWLKCTL